MSIFSIFYFFLNWLFFLCVNTNDIKKTKTTHTTHNQPTTHAKAPARAFQRHNPPPHPISISIKRVNTMRSTSTSGSLKRTATFASTISKSPFKSKSRSSPAVIQRRKERNRSAAQKSRDRKHLYIGFIENETRIVKEILRETQIQLQMAKEMCFQQQMQIKHLQTFAVNNPVLLLSPTLTTNSSITTPNFY